VEITLEQSCAYLPLPHNSSFAILLTGFFDGRLLTPLVSTPTTGFDSAFACTTKDGILSDKWLFRANDAAVSAFFLAPRAFDVIDEDTPPPTPTPPLPLTPVLLSFFDDSVMSVMWCFNHLKMKYDTHFSTLSRIENTSSHLNQVSSQKLVTYMHGCLLAKNST
jgi:hypothetical protein